MHDTLHHHSKLPPDTHSSTHTYCISRHLNISSVILNWTTLTSVLRVSESEWCSCGVFCLSGTGDPPPERYWYYQLRKLSVSELRKLNPQILYNAGGWRAVSCWLHHPLAVSMVGALQEVQLRFLSWANTSLSKIRDVRSLSSLTPVFFLIL